MIAFIIANRKIIGLLIFIFGWSLGCYQAGRNSALREWEAEKLAASLAAIEIERKNVKTGFEIGSGYETIKGNIDLSFNGYVNSLSDTADIAAKTNTASKPNEASCRDGLSKENKRKLLELAREAEINTQQLVALQKWVEEVR